MTPAVACRPGPGTCLVPYRKFDTSPDQMIDRIKSRIVTP
jgi:hypothetical protein